MALIATITEDRAQVDGRRYIRCRFTDAGSGKTFTRLRLIQSGDDAQVIVDVQAASVEEGEKFNELQRLSQQVLEGTNPRSLTPDLSTQDEFFAHLLKLLANTHDRDEIVAYAPALARFTDTEAARHLGVPRGDVTAWRVVIESVKTASDNYTHNLPFYEEVE